MRQLVWLWMAASVLACPSRDDPPPSIDVAAAVDDLLAHLAEPADEERPEAPPEASGAGATEAVPTKAEASTRKPAPSRAPSAATRVIPVDLALQPRFTLEQVDVQSSRRVPRAWAKAVMDPTLTMDQVGPQLRVAAHDLLDRVMDTGVRLGGLSVLGYFEGDNVKGPVTRGEIHASPDGTWAGANVDEPYSSWKVTLKVFDPPRKYD